ncbi:ATPase PAAT [Sarcophilus harrisii]|uniref:Chromosome 10 open reading frame 88 n=1 Tax=Sarcophilus harrisii TaxID=9305 RepID=A0A7N4PL06_SARHA|nr:ATPase PAAT [Sarcophilus harrisii]
MEPGAEDCGEAPRLMASSSWEAPQRGLAQSLSLALTGLGGPDGGGGGGDSWEEEVLGPPALGEDLVLLKRKVDNEDESSCFLYLKCSPHRCEEIVSLGILSEARNMEVYAREEYCGTSRGENVCTVQQNSENEITLYKKYLKLECPTDYCKIKLLSFGDKQSIFVSKIVVQLKAGSANSSISFPALGSRIDLDRVQTMMESMGSKLSPGAQQLMNMVRFQQRNCIPFGEQLQCFLGKKEPPVFGDEHIPDGLHKSTASGVLDKSSSTSFPLKSGLTSGAVTEDIKAYTDKNTELPARGNIGSIPDLEECKSVQQNNLLPENDLKFVVSSWLQKKANDNSNIPSSELLPFLQNLCSQVNHLRVGDKNKPQGNTTKPNEGVVNIGVEQQPVCSYLEKIISKNLELMEKKLMDYIDQRMYKLQEHIDNKVVLLMDLLQNSNSTSTRVTQEHYDSGERLSNGER